MVTVADPVNVADDSIHSPVNPETFRCHEPFAVADVTAVVAATGIIFTAFQVAPPLAVM